MGEKLTASIACTVEALWERAIHTDNINQMITIISYSCVVIFLNGSYLIWSQYVSGFHSYTVRGRKLNVVAKNVCVKNLMSFKIEVN